MSKKRILTITAAGAATAVLAALAVPAIANAADGKADNSKSHKPSSSAQKTPGAHHGDHKGGPFASLGLTAEQMQKVHDALEAQHEANEASHDADRKAAESKVLADLVSAGTLTQAQADAITATQSPEDFRALVDNGTITEEQAHALFEAMRANHSEPSEQDTAKVAAEVTAALAPLVADGTLTQAQADAIAKAFSEHRGGPGGRGPGGREHGRGPGDHGVPPSGAMGSGQVNGSMTMPPVPQFEGQNSAS